VTTFGLSLAASVREPIDRIAQLLARAEALGFSRGYVLDSQMAFKDVYVTLAVAALRTRNIMLGTGVTNPITRDLTVTASSISAIQEVSNGRAVLGLGNGATSVEGIGLTGSDLVGTRQAVVKLRALLDGHAIEHNGVEIKMSPAPDRVPIFLSGSRPRMLRLAGEVGDGVILMGPSHPRLLEEQLDAIFDGLRKAGRSRAEFHVDLWQTISVSDDRERAIDDVKSWVASQLVWWFARADSIPAELRRAIDWDRVAAFKSSYDITQHLSLRAAHRELVSPELADLMAIAGDVDHAIARLRELGSLDVDSVTLSLLSGGREARLETLGRVIAAA
jgi:5,10-methylenetetrahydromethanopterin reductase